MNCAKMERFSQLQRNPSNIRNLCIMAHVDHGKTTLADALIASNGIISQKLAGKLRYMDSREDEQQRGITMKSSAIALYHRRDDEEYLINLIDSPGHVDFTNEVSTGVRLCDGAIILVDVVEGVCAQTKVSLKQAWIEGLKPVLILNKMDRLIVEQKMSPLDAYVHLQQILEQVNAVVGELFTTEILSKLSKESDSGAERKRHEVSGDELYDWSSGLEETDDSNVYFSPDQGNVTFACALDGWGFGISHFAKMYTEKLGIKESVLLKTLWGDYYLNGKTKRIVKGAQARAKKPLFVQFILENLWSVYEAVVERKDPQMMEKIISSLKLEIKPRDLKCSDSRMLLQLICSQWLPLSKSALDMVCEKLPGPLQMSEERCEKLMCGNGRRFDSLPNETQRLKQHFVACSSNDDVPTIVFVSKMFTVDSRDLPKFKQRPLTIEEIMERREKSRQLKLALLRARDDRDKGDAAEPPSSEDDKAAEQEEGERERERERRDLPVFVAFARVFSGCLRRGQRVYVLGPKHDPAVALENQSKGMFISEALTLKDLKSDQHMTSFEVSDLYLLMGRQLEMLEQVPAGNIVGIGGLEEHVLKSATLSSALACPSFTDLHVQSPPIVRVALEPAHTVDMPALVRGLKLLNQADAAVRVQIQESGEHVIVTTGEVHLQRCLDDLRKSFAKVEILASQPIVPFRETIIVPPKVDMMNEMIDGQPNKSSRADAAAAAAAANGLVSMHTANKACTLKLRAVPLPDRVTGLLEDNARVLEALDGEKVLSREMLDAVDVLRVKLQDAFDEAGTDWTNATEEIWAFGPRRQGPNLLLNRDREHRQPSVWNLDRRETRDSFLCKWEGSLTGGFQLATLAGPLCEEPMRGVCVVFEECEHAEPGEASADPYGPFSGQLMSAMKEGCRRAFQAQPQRLMTAMYTCNILVTTDMLGKLYAVLGKRSGQVLASDLVEGSQMFDVTATLPVVESFDFANEIRKQTSGHAMPQLVFTHWQVLDIDPFWVPSTEEEYAHFGEKADSENRARKYVNAVRRRKGLSVDEQVVEHAEKQRTLTRNK